MSLQVEHYINHLDPSKRESHVFDAGQTLAEITKKLCDHEEWQVPTIALVNGDPWLRARWSDPIPDGSLIEFRSLPQGGGKNTGQIIGGIEFVAGLVIAITTGWTGVGLYVGVALMVGGAAAIAGSLLAQELIPSVPSAISAESGSPSYSYETQNNRKRIGEPIPVCYGKNRLVPDQVTSSYVWFEDNNQFFGAVMCLGRGSFEVDESTIRLGETKISELQGVTYQIVNPGDPQTLIDDFVSVSGAINGQTLRYEENRQIIGNSHSVTLSTFVRFGANRIQIECNDPIFSPVIDRKGTVTISGTTNYNGTYQIESVGYKSNDPATYERGSRIWLYSGDAISLWSPETTSYGEIFGTYLGKKTYFTYAPSRLSFAHNVSGEERIYTVDFPEAFQSLVAGDDIVISGSASNNNRYTVTYVSPPTTYPHPYPYITVLQTVTDEFDILCTMNTYLAGWTSWVNPAIKGSSADFIEFDLIAKNGLYKMNTDGTYSYVNVDVTFEFQETDSSGNVIGDATYSFDSVGGSDRTPIRKTVRKVNSLNHVRVRVKLTDARSEDSTVVDEVCIAQIKGVMPNVGTYPGCTIFAIRGMATEQLTGAQIGQVNLEATRKISAWNGTAWGAIAASSSIAWALADALKDPDYGCGLSDGDIDLAALLALDSIWAAREDYFNAIFDQTTTAWEAISKIARAGRAIPVLAGGKVTFVRDAAKTLRTAIFTPSTMIPDSLSIDYRLPKDGDPDGTSAAWLDPDANWKPAHIDLIDGSASLPVNPQNCDLFGVTNLAQATREATYLDRVRKYQRKSIKFSTEMDGHLVSVGDLIGVSHDVPAWGSSGFITDYNALGVGGPIWTTSEILGWIDLATHAILLKRPDGSVAGPFTATKVTGTTNQFQIATTPDFTPNTDPSVGDRTAYTFGKNDAYIQDCIVASVTPSSNNTVEITCSPYDARIHASGA
jgi:predicted phage tail protein